MAGAVPGVPLRARRRFKSHPPTPASWHGLRAGKSLAGAAPTAPRETWAGVPWGQGGGLNTPPSLPQHASSEPGCGHPPPPQNKEQGGGRNLVGAASHPGKPQLESRSMEVVETPSLLPQCLSPGPRCGHVPCFLLKQGRKLWQGQPSHLPQAGRGRSVAAPPPQANPS